MTGLDLQAPSAWINRRHEELQRSYKQSRNITYATNYDEPVNTTIGDVVTAIIGAASLYAGIALLILILT